MTDPHPDDESLSAALDGEDATTASHVASCVTCLARSDTLRAAGRAIGATDTARASATLTDRAVAAALAAFAAERGAGAGGVTIDGAGDGTTAGRTIGTIGTAGGGGGKVAPLRPAPTGESDSFTSHGRVAGDSRRRVPPGWLVGVAAALVALAVAVPVLTGGGTKTDTVATAANDDSAKMSALAGAPAIDGGDIGEQSDQAALGGIVTGALRGASVGAAAADQASPPSVPASGVGEVAGPSRSATAPDDPLAADRDPLAAPAPESAAPPAAAAGASDAAGATCEATVAKDYAKALNLGALVYRATLRWKGTPAVLLTYRLAETSGPGADHQTFVMATDGCRLLVVQGS